jgi:hypothetical protein
LVADRRAKALDMALAGEARLAIGLRLSASPDQSDDPHPVGYGWERLRRGHGPLDETGLVDAVRKDVGRSLAERRRALGQSADEYLDVHMARLERLLTGVWDKAAAGDLSSSLQALRILSREQRLQGLDGRQALSCDVDLVDDELEAGVADLVDAVEQSLRLGG